MKNKLSFLIKHSLDKKYKSKWFKIVNIFLLLAICLLVNIDSVIKFFGGDFNNNTEIIIIDKSNHYEEFINNYKSFSNYLNIDKEVEFTNYIGSNEDAIKEVSEDDKILLEIDNDENDYITAKVTTNKNIDTITYTIINNSLNAIRSNIVLNNYNITEEMYANISKGVNIETITLEKDDSNDILGSIVVPILVMPIFFLSIYLVQLIGAEINEEKSTKSMEIILTNVSPKTHFISKIIASNIFIISEGLLLVIYAIIGLIIRKQISGNILESLNIGIANKLEINTLLTSMYKILPIVIILLLLTLIAYSLLGGVLASMTTNSEDYQQLQTPIVLISLIGFYLSTLANLFKGSLFIKIMSYVPFISSLLSPSLYIMGEITIYDMIISLLLILIVIYLLIKYGIRVYKEGILNYSNDKLWNKIFKSVKRKKI